MVKGKITPTLRFPKFESAWDEKILGDIGIFIGGGTPSTKNLDFWEGDIPWISSSDLSDENIYSLKASRFITNEAVSQSATKLIPKKSILIVSRVGVGKVVVNDVELCTSQDFTNLIPHSDNYIFLAYLIKFKTNKLLEFNQGTSIKGFVKSDLETLRVSLPPLPEQQKIASFLTSVDERIQQLTRKKNLLEQYKKGVMQKIFSREIRFKDDKGKDFPDWKEKKLGDIGKFISGTGFSDDEQGGLNGIPFYKVSDMNLPDNNIEMKVANHYVTEEQIRRLKYKVINSTALIFAKVGAAIFLERKRIAINFLIDNNMMAFIPSGDISFFYHLFNQIKLSQFAQVGALPSYNSSDLSIIKVFLPCDDEQIKIASFLTVIDKKINLVNTQLQKTQVWKKGLLQKMFV